MSAIVSCRTAALGGHVTRCEDCGHTQIAYNSCRNRHCPKCQGAAARDWLAEREADLLPVPYFHVVFTLPAAIADIAYQNKAVIYDLLFKASSEALLTIAADPKHLGARIGDHRRAPHLGLGHDPSSARPHDRARWRDRARWLQVDRVQAGLLPAGARALEALPQADAGEARRGACRRQAAVLRRARSISPTADAFAAFLAPLRTTSWFVYAKRPFAGPQAVLAYLARYTHRVAISNRRLIALDADGVTFRYKDYRRNGQERYRTMTLVPGEFIRRFLLHVLPKGFHRIRHYGLLASAARKANIARARELLAAPEPETVPDETTRRRRGADRPSPAMPVLRRAHDHRRDLRARRRPARPAAVRTRGQDRGRMTPNRASPHRKPAGRPAPPATARRHPRPIDPTPRTANRTDIDRPGRA